MRFIGSQGCLAGISLRRPSILFHLLNTKVTDLEEKCGPLNKFSPLNPLYGPMAKKVNVPLFDNLVSSRKNKAWKIGLTEEMVEIK
ncbi:hypothetical protein HanPI659440_Chr06g0234151 [Helianthus annuus]|nr:hypothetical protein HanPI659440_Chr06g0234151 [Helianthus annuus]